jgi:hypothetical protein
MLAFAFLSIFVVLPAGLCVADIALLPLLGSTAEKDHDCLAVLAEIDAVTGPNVSLYSNTPAPTPLMSSKRGD